MQGARLSLTNRELVEPNQVVAVGQFYFEMNWFDLPATNSTNEDSFYRLKVFHHGGPSISAISPPKPGSKAVRSRDNVFDVYIDSLGANSFFNQLVQVFSNVPVQHPPAAIIQICDSTGNKTSETFSFDLEFLAQLPDNIGLYAFALTKPPPPAPPAQALSFKVTSTDAGGILSVVDSLIYSNYPRNPF